MVSNHRKNKQTNKKNNQKNKRPPPKKKQFITLSIFIFHFGKRLKTIVFSEEQFL